LGEYNSKYNFRAHLKGTVLGVETRRLSHKTKTRSNSLTWADDGERKIRNEDGAQSKKYNVVTFLPIWTEVLTN